MRSLFLSAVIAAGAIATSASAQDTTFRGFRVEGDAGWDQYKAGGDTNAKFGFGGQIGFDGQIGKKIVIGPEFNYWRPNRSQNTVGYLDGAGDQRIQQSRYQMGGAIRVGFLATPDLLVYGKGGYVNNAQRTYVYSPAGALTAATHGHADGYQYGGGVEYTLHDRVSFVPTGVYVSAQYVRDEYDNHTSDQHAMGGIGFRFR
jgi:outer membrane immunogenic protein